MPSNRSATCRGPEADVERLRDREGLAWLAGLLLASAAAVALLRGLEPGTARTGLSLLALLAFAAPLLLLRAPSASASALAAGAVAGWVVGVAVALPVPAGWFFPDVAWHTAKAAVAAAGHPLDDPILRAPTLYPFLFALFVGAPVALGLSPAAAMWAAAPISLTGTFFAYHRLARTQLEPRAAAWAAVALPLFLYSPARGYALLASPFGLSLGFVFGGLALGLGGLERGNGRRLAAAGLLLGTAGLIWYAHLPWLLLWVLWLAWRQPRRLAPLALGAAPCALLFLLHLGVLAGRGLLGDDAVTSPANQGGWPHWLGLVGRSALSLSSGSLAETPFWIGPLLLVLMGVAWRRRPARGRLLQPALAAACVALAGVAVVLGARLTYGEFFLWRYGFVLYAVLLLAAAAARPFQLAGRGVPALLAAALAAAVCVPGWLASRYENARADQQRYEATVRDVDRFLAEHTDFDEPVFAPFGVWEGAIGCCLPRPNLVDRQGGLYKYASAKLVAQRWSTYHELRRSRDAEQAAALLRPYGFRYAVLRTRSEAPGFAALSRGFEVVLRNEQYVVVDLSRPRRDGGAAR